MGLKILHSADWHLDSPFAGFSDDQRKVLKAQQRRIPGLVADLCRREDCDMVLLAGDLLDGQASRETLEDMKKELRRFTSSAVYMMNCGLGLVLILIAAVMAAVKAPALLAMLPAQWEPFTAAVATLILCFLGFANDITAPSVSLEGKSLWISQTLPIDMYHVLMAKVHLQLVLCAPVLLAASVVFAVVLRTDVQLTVLMVLLPQLMNLLNALFGLTMNLAFPKFDWANEAVPVKQGMALLLTMLSTMVYTIAPALLYFFALGSLLSPTAFLWIYGALTAVLSALLWQYLRTRGAKKYGVMG